MHVKQNDKTNIWFHFKWDVGNKYFNLTFKCQHQNRSPQIYCHLQGPVSQKILSPLVVLSMEKTMVVKVISEILSVSRLKDFFQKLAPGIVNPIRFHLSKIKQIVKPLVAC